MIFSISIKQKKKWNYYVSRSAKFDFYHTWYYHSLVKIEDPILLIYEKEDDFIAFPLLKRKINNSPYFDLTSVYGYSGPISNHNFENISEELIEDFKTAILEYLKIGNYISVFSRLHPFFSQRLLLNNFGGVFTNGKTVAINLKKPIEEQRYGYKKDLFRRILNLKRKGFYVKEVTTLSQIIEYKNIYIENMIRVGAKESYMFSEDYFQNMLNSKEFNCKLIAVFIGNKIVAGQIITCTQNIIQSHLSATSKDYLQYSPAKLLNDEISIIGRELGMHFYHLGSGVGFKEDSLFAFKATFSNLFLTFRSWRYIVDQVKYQELLENAEVDPNTNVDFFPLYRYQKASDSCNKKEKQVEIQQ